MYWGRWPNPTKNLDNRRQISNIVPSIIVSKKKAWESRENGELIPSPPPQTQSPDTVSDSEMMVMLRFCLRSDESRPSKALTSVFNYKKHSKIVKICGLSIVHEITTNLLKMTGHPWTQSQWGRINGV